MLRTLISSDINILNSLSKSYLFLPNECNIRPTPELIKQKEQSIKYISSYWSSMYDYMKHSVFNVKAKINKDGIMYTDDTPTQEWIFKQAQYPYNISNGNHWILWKYSDSMTSFDISNNVHTINKIIETRLYLSLKHNNFNFAWYPNPKPSIPEFFHVQVFWQEL